MVITRLELGSYTSSSLFKEPYFLYVKAVINFGAGLGSWLGCYNK
jgi:hypothetical protein